MSSSDHGSRNVEQLGGELDFSATPQTEFSQGPALREYQASAVRDIRAAFLDGVSRLAFTLPTGGGKTVILAEIIRGEAARGARVLVLVHRIELLAQTSRALAALGIAHGVIAPGSPATGEPVQVAMVSTIGRRLDAWRDWADFGICDECHHAVAGSWAAVLASQPRARVLGVTATPERLDGRGLRERFDALIVGPSVAELIAAGFLASFVVYEPARPNLAGARIVGGDYVAADLRTRGAIASAKSVIAEWLKLCAGVPTLSFSPDLQHSRDVVAEALARGKRAAHVDGETPAAERRAAIAALGAGELDLISNVALFGEGLDLPNVGAVLMCRPTASLGLYLQMIGRALRPAPGKSRALILDVAGNCAAHGLPDAPRAWSLDARPRRQRGEAEALHPRHCPACSALNPPKSRECEECGADLTTEAERREIEIQLEQSRKRDAIERLKGKPYWWRLKWAGADQRRLELLAEMHGYAKGWTWHQRQRALAAEAQRGIE